MACGCVLSEQMLLFKLKIEGCVGGAMGSGLLGCVGGAMGVVSWDDCMVYSAS